MISYIRVVAVACIIYIEVALKEATFTNLARSCGTSHVRDETRVGGTYASRTRTVTTITLLATDYRPTPDPFAINILQPW